MADIIIFGALILGIVITIRGAKEQIKAFRNMGLMLIILCSIYIIPSSLIDFCKGFLDGLMGY